MKRFHHWGVMKQVIEELADAYRHPWEHLDDILKNRL
jgi:hypothetical protein